MILCLQIGRGVYVIILLFSDLGGYKMKFDSMRFKKFCWRIPTIIIVGILIYLAININKAKVLSTYDKSTETIILYNATREQLNDVFVRVYLDCDVYLDLTVNHLPSYEEKKLVISEKLPTNFSSKVTKLNVKVFKLNIRNLILISILAVVNYFYCIFYEEYFF